MNDIKYIDSHASLGKWSLMDVEAPWTVERMLDDMERCGIHGALVYHNFAKELQPSVGNDKIFEICQKHPRLIPCWVTLPDVSGQAPEGAQFVRAMVDNGVKAVKLFPRLHRYMLDNRTMGSLLNSLQEAELPMLIDCGMFAPELEQIHWDEIPPLYNDFPDLKIILHNVRWEALKFFLPLLREFPNLHLEFSSCQGNRFFEFLVEKIGSDQLLFGTAMMQKSPGAAKAFVDYSDISDEHRRKIAGGNLIRLLKLDNVPVGYPKNEITDKILLKVRKAEPIDDMEVIDSHAHFTEKGRYDIVDGLMGKSDAAGLIERNSRIGVDITCASPWNGIAGRYESGNESTRQAIEEFPDSFVGYATFDPRFVKDWPAELKRCYEEFGMKGIKPYFPRNGVPYNDSLYDAWFGYGNKHHLFALMHMSDNFVREMEELAPKYPEISFILAHSGWTWKVAREHSALAKKFKNVFCEITFTAVTNGIIEFLIREIGSEKVLYGSDTVMRDPIPQFGWVVYADISEDEKRNILGRNMRKIVDRCLRP